MNHNTFFVTIGHPSSNIPIIIQAIIFVDLDETSPTKVAKKLRKDVADRPWCYGYTQDTRFKPSELYFHVYSDKDNPPLYFSENSPYYNMKIDLLNS